jgi:hypothetical protein
MVHTEKPGGEWFPPIGLLGRIKAEVSLGASGGSFTVSSDPSKASTTLPGVVEKVIQPHPNSGEPEKAQIAVEGADHLYREIRVPNTLTDENGRKVKLEEGAEVDIKIEADSVVTKAGPAGKVNSRPRP